MTCQNCGLEYYHNTATAVGALLEYDGQVMLTQRARDPGRGQWDLPGGFVDYRETLEEALSRELHEELGIRLSEFEYLCSHHNSYRFKTVEYQTADVFFSASLESLEDIAANDDVQAIALVDPKCLEGFEISFTSVNVALQAWLRKFQT